MFKTSLAFFDKERGKAWGDGMVYPEILDKVEFLFK
jgi:hypothetical protein